MREEHEVVRKGRNGNGDWNGNGRKKRADFEYEEYLVGTWRIDNEKQRTESQQQRRCNENELL